MALLYEIQHKVQDITAELNFSLPHVSVYLEDLSIFSAALCSSLISGLGAVSSSGQMRRHEAKRCISITVQKSRERFTAALCSQGNKLVRWVILVHYRP